MRCLIFAFASVLAPGLLAAQPVAPTAEIPQVVDASNRDASWRPSEAQISKVLSRTTQYFRARDTGNVEEAYALFSPSQKAMVPLAAWRSAIEDFNSRAGTGERALKKVTWYKDPPQRPGVYAAVDFSSQFGGLALHCGYIIWQEQMGGEFAVSREEDNVIDRATAERLQPGQIEQVRAQFRC